MKVTGLIEVLALAALLQIVKGNESENAVGVRATSLRFPFHAVVSRQKSPKIKANSLM
jgi:hypothetical protein